MSETFSLWHADAAIVHVSRVVTDLTPRSHLLAISAGRHRLLGRFLVSAERRAR
jgi:hypothetical protein